MSALAFPHLWIPRRKLWTPWDAVFTAGKAQRKSDGKLPRNVSTGTAGKTPRNTTGTTCCCVANTPSPCYCNNTLTNPYFTHLTVVVTGCTIPTGVCLYDCISGASANFSVANVNGTYCLPFLSGGFGSDCRYGISDTTGTLAAGLTDDGHGGVCNTSLVGAAWVADLNQTTVLWRIRLTPNFGFNFFSATGIALTCGGTTSGIANTAVYCTGPGGVGSTSIGGTMTIADGGC